MGNAYRPVGGLANMLSQHRRATQLRTASSPQGQVYFRQRGIRLRYLTPEQPLVAGSS